jgi:hypothetical protein
MQLPLYKILKNGIKVELDYMHKKEQEEVRELLNMTIAEGNTYPQKQPLSPSEFAAYWLNHQAFVVRSFGESTTQAPNEILGAFWFCRDAKFCVSTLFQVGVAIYAMLVLLYNRKSEVWGLEGSWERQCF